MVLVTLAACDVYKQLEVGNRNHKLEISTAPTKAKSREPAYWEALIWNKINRQRVRDPDSQAGRQRESGGYGGWCLQL